MKELFNFEAILAIVFFALSVLLFVTTLKNKKRLGELILPTLSGVKNSDLVVQMILIILLMGFTIFSAIYDQSEKNYQLFYILFPIALVFYFLNAVILATSQKGMYENGMFTSSGILPYSSISVYDTVPIPKKNIVKFRFNPKKGLSNLFGMTAYVNVKPGKERELKSYLKKRCSFKK